ncbi:histidine kinase [Haematobacter massiliensis]|uniref:histidine kinase n=1 Tax=Haematobacter massiliensis TaxID=195105 RepID=A0A086YB57_9RHOB|nr:ATP-binding protein [Haematobacter massiliensis]KFI31507.1 histidine kinase [Haematobacter massiliensis]
MKPPATSPPTARKNMGLLIQLRWIAVAGQIVAIAFAAWFLGVHLPLVPMSAVVACLVLLNAATILWLRRADHVPGRVVFMALTLDVLALTAQLALSGGASNPFVTLYVVQVALGAMMLRPPAGWFLVALTSCLFALLIVLHRPLGLPPDGPSFFNLYIAGMFVGLTLDAVLVVAFLTRVAANLRQSDARVARLRQQAAEEDHIVRMGLLASGAAHELSTPLASISVILGDWRRMPKLSEDPELRQEIETMRTSVDRCKTIITGILMTSGAARGEGTELTTVHSFVARISRDWQSAHPGVTLERHNDFGEDVGIVSDATLRQIVMNVLDNAVESSPGWVGLDVQREGAMLLLRVTDRGPGFSSRMLDEFGRPYQSTKGRQGRGLGLFLVVNAIRKLGGSVSAGNRPEGGAEVTLRLPLHLLSAEDEDDNDGDWSDGEWDGGDDPSDRG